MLKLTVTYTTTDAAGTVATNSVTAEVPDDVDDDHLRHRLHELVALVREGIATRATPIPPAPPRQPANGNGRSQPANNGRPTRASARQVQFIVDLATRSGLDRQQLDTRAFQRYGSPVDGLTRHQASGLIEDLRATARAAA